MLFHEWNDSLKHSFSLMVWFINGFLYYYYYYYYSHLKIIIIFLSLSVLGCGWWILYELFSCIIQQNGKNLKCVIKARAQTAKARGQWMPKLTKIEYNI